jgi:hypothetical protein
VGFSAFTVVYGISAVTGGAFIDDGQYGTSHEQLRMGRGLLVPGIGPFIAAGHSSSYALGAGLVINGFVQLGCIAMGITGAVRLGKTRRHARLSSSTGGLALQF